MSRKNTFSRALRHLNQINEQIPTNNTQGLYTIGDPSRWIPPEDNTYTELDFSKDNDIDEGKNTDGLFLSDGTILTVEPPGDTSYVLGPMSSMWYAWGNFTRIGYIRQSDRKMVNLGSITGQLGSWDEETFTSYGQLTLEQAVWFKNIQKKDEGSNDDPNYRAFYPGPPSNTPDEFGRYLCVITGKPKEFGDKTPGYSTSPEQGPGDASDNYSAQKGRDGDRDKDKDDGFDWDKLWDMVDAGLIVLDAISLAGLLFPELGSSVLGGLGLGVVRVLRGLKTVLRGGSTARKLNRRNRIRYEKPKKSNITYDNPSGKPKDPMDKVLRDIDNAGTGPWTSSSYNPHKPGGGPGRKRFGGGESFELQGNTLLEQNLDTVDLPEIIRNLVKDNITSNMKKTSGNLTNKEIEDYMVDRLITLTKDPKFEKNLDKLMSKLDKSKGIKESLSESFFTQRKKKILREVKKPYNMPEVPTKFKVKPKVRVVGDGLMKNKSVPPQFKSTSDNRMWRKSEYSENIRASQEKKNQVLELIGEGDHQWNYMLNNKRWRTSQQMEKLYGNHDYLYDYYYGGKNHKVLRKENLEKDFLLFLEDEDGVKSNILQSELNDLLAYEKDNEDFKDHYLYEIEQNEREKNFDRVNKIKKVVSQSTNKRDIAPEYPKDPPPEMINGWHPKLADGKDIANRFNKLDPQSAEAMPKTDNPHIDAKVEKAKNNPDKDGPAYRQNVFDKVKRKKIADEIREQIREELRNLDEGMTTSGFLQTTLPEMGDVDLENIDNKLSSTGTSDGASNSGNTYNFGPVSAHIVDGTGSSMTLKNVDASKFDTISFDFLGGTIDEFYLIPLLLASNPQGLRQYNLSTGSGRKTITLQSVDRVSGLEFAFYVARGGSNNLPVGTNIITNLSFQRRTPMNVFVGLDDPEASAFIRTDPSLQGLSPEAKKKKLMDMLDASDEYLLKQLGIIGSKARPSDVTMPDSWDTAAQTQQGGKVYYGTYAGRVPRVPRAKNTTSNWGLDRRLGDQLTSISKDRWVGNRQVTRVPRAKNTTSNWGLDRQKMGKKDTTSNFGLNRQKGTSAQNIQNRDKSASRPLRSFMDIRIGDKSSGASTAAQTQKDKNKKKMGDTQIAMNDDLYNWMNKTYGLPAAEWKQKNPTKPDNSNPFLPKGSYVPKAEGSGNNDTQIAWEPGDPWPSKDGPLDGPQGPDPNRPWVPEVPTAKRKSKKTTMVTHHEPKGNPLMEKKKFDAVEPQGKVISEKKTFKDLTKKIPGYYDGKPAPLGFPMQEPPKMKNGFHPDLVDGKNISNRYNKLDPQSAKAMPKTGNPHIDAKVEKAKNKPK